MSHHIDTQPDCFALPLRSTQGFGSRQSHRRSVVGSYHKVSRKHLDAYLDELEWRFNNRENPYLFRDTLLKLSLSSNLTYENLLS